VSLGPRINWVVFCDPKNKKYVYKRKNLQKSLFFWTETNFGRGSQKVLKISGLICHSLAKKFEAKEANKKVRRICRAFKISRIIP